MNNRNFQHTVKYTYLSFLDKVKSRETITLVNNENIESNENEVAKPFDDLFSNIVKNLTKFRSSSVKMIYTIDYPVIQPCKLY